MAVEENIRFAFTSAALPEETFVVAEFRGTEAMSKLYRFDITLYADDPEIDLKAVLKNPVKLTVEKDGEVLRRFHGVLSRFEQLHEYSGHAYFRAVLVPRLWIADQYQENQLFLDKKIPDIIEDVLKQTGLTSLDYELRLTGTYRAWEYICQYNETDFNFISRWMEREGIYYYFEQGEDAEKIIITDSSTAHENIASSDSIRYSPPDSLSPTSMHQVREFTCHQQLLPKKVVLKDYNYRKPSLDLKGEADVDPEGRGNVSIYGEHFKTPEEGNALAAIRAEELLCREALFFGEGTVPSFLTGYFFEMHDHYRDSYNQRYLITELSHQGVQSTYLTGAGGADLAPEKQTPAYVNTFSAIPAAVQFRPERLAEKTRLDGTLNATVDAAGDGQYAEIDDQGRYKVKLPFDQSNAADGKASRWVRMAQPYAGADYGMHFPLHKGTEVLLTFVDGDPDRPIIAGTVPNPETGSPVTGANQSQSMIRTAGGNQIRIEDNDGGQQIHMSSPTSNSIISLGDVNEGNIFLKSDGTWVSKIGDNAIEKLGADKRTYVKGSEVKDITGNQGVHIGGSQALVVNTNRDVIVYGKENKEVKGNSWCKVNGPKSSMTVGATHEVCVAAKATQSLSAVSDVTVGVKQGAFAGANIETNAAAKLEFNATVKYEKSVTKSNKAVKIEQDATGLIKLICGGSSIKMTPGSIEINSPKILIKGSPIDIEGGLVRLKGNIQNKDGLKSNKDSFFDKAIHAKNFSSL